MAEAVIVEAVRSPVGKRNGGLSGVHPGELSAQVLNGLADRFARGIHVIVPADGNGGDVADVFVDDRLRRIDQFGRQISVRDDDASD